MLGWHTGGAEEIMTDVHDDVPTRRWSAPAIQRQPVVHPDRTVFAWALRAEAVPPLETDTPRPDQTSLDRAVDAEFALLDLASLAGDRPLLLHCTPRILSGEQRLAATGCELVLELPGKLAEAADLTDQVDRIRAEGGRLALGDYTGTPAQDTLLDRVHLVKIAADTDPETFTALVARAHQAGAAVVAEHADTHADVKRALAGGADLLQGPMFQRDADVLAQEFSSGELQCLELMALLSDEPVDQAAVIGLVAADPMLTVRVLHLVNSSAFGLPREIDSVRQAVVLVGPHHLSALAVSALVGAHPSTVSELWTVLTRALACWDLSGDDSGYTVGLLSAVADQRRVDPGWLATMAGLSEEATAALVGLRGPVGAALASIRAYEFGDPRVATGFAIEPPTVSRAWLKALPEALGIAAALTSA